MTAPPDHLEKVRVEGERSGDDIVPRPSGRISVFCADLPTDPRPELGTVLVTGATGYVGGRLVPELVARGYRVRIMVRAITPDLRERFPEVEVAEADARDPVQLEAALDGVHTAYYLIHSLLLGPGEFASADIQAAANFRETAERRGVARIIYLGGLGDARSVLSGHLQSRMEVAEALEGGAAAVTILRAGIIIGSGSASYEIIKHLVLRLPLVLVPRWANTCCQPIAIRDVVKYLVGCLEEPATEGRRFDIGGDDILTYRLMLETTAHLLHRRCVFLNSPISWLGPYAYVASLITPVPGAITRCLMEGVRNEVVCQEGEIRDVLPLDLKGFSEAIVAAMSREEQDRVRTRWSDAYPPSHELAMKLHEVEGGPEYQARYSILSPKPAARLFASLCRVGGQEGWFHNNWMWWLRGMVDWLLGGVGASRGRRSRTRLHINDVIDFWRVEDLRRDERLLLRAEMKLPGKAWLEFEIEDLGEERRVGITASYDTSGFLGRAYWYLFLPFHHFIFTDLLVQIEARA